ncbi:nuclear pore complex protein Nup160-like [Anarrhichthys ocellatus]|uniref:nuclear pore complex protein Nup160-like n=1 Tax=Anarrhichthys ocellatus TaxID=433405 RepID=UPI0012EE3A6C|nr:nuclear pore complex protein Nup160-like [Anarrhichthys ocellatus]
MLGQCYLANGEGQKALQCFQEAATEVEKEEFLMKLTGTEEEASTPRLQYYNKVLRLLEDVGLPELVIQLASLAITEAVSDVNSQVTFSRQTGNIQQTGRQTALVVFKHGLFDTYIN